MARKWWILIPVALVVLVVVCCLVWFVAGLVAAVLEDYPETMLEDEAAVEPGQLSSDSTVEEWYHLAVHILEEHEWQVSPNLTGLYLSLQCAPDSHEPVLHSVHMQFADAYFVGIIPSIKFGDVYLQSANATASVAIAYHPLRWRHKEIDIATINVGWRQALEISQQQDGATFQREVGDRCTVGLNLDDHEWRVSYGDSGASPRWIGPTIWIDARTGTVLKIE
jgi:hypothetical protein